mmetsp:Transcript_47987/g.133707  ORF Transcript_47987/g.133707 Transcript_47987/m.133707 type:complete len:339 (+) Transcript_47987:250-1266(+)
MQATPRPTKKRGKAHGPAEPTARCPQRRPAVHRVSARCCARAPWASLKSCGGDPPTHRGLGHPRSRLPACLLPALQPRVDGLELVERGGLRVRAIFAVGALPGVSGAAGLVPDLIHVQRLLDPEHVQTVPQVEVLAPVRPVELLLAAAVALFVHPHPPPRDDLHRAVHHGVVGGPRPNVPVVAVWHVDAPPSPRLHVAAEPRREQHGIWVHLDREVVGQMMRRCENGTPGVDEGLHVGYGARLSHAAVHDFHGGGLDSHSKVHHRIAHDRLLVAVKDACALGHHSAHEIQLSAESDREAQERRTPPRLLSQKPRGGIAGPGAVVDPITVHLRLEVLER